MAGAVAALNYFIAKGNGFIEFMDEGECEYLTTMVSRLVELVGTDVHARTVVQS